MRTVAEAAEELREALAARGDVIVTTNPGATIDPPAVLFGPPVLDWEGYGPRPTTATFTLYVITMQDDILLERLWELVPSIVETVESVTDAVVPTATPGTVPAGGVDLPSYALRVEMSL